MNALQRAWQRARRRRALITLVLGLPLALAATALALRLSGFDLACVVGTLVVLACAAVATARARQLDRRWLQRQLDASGASEDSADLLFAETATLNPLQQRQRTHVLDTLERRVTKLSGVLESTQAELRTALGREFEDPGVGSVYTDVQGLNDGDSKFDKKTALMASQAFLKPGSPARAKSC